MSGHTPGPWRCYKMHEESVWFVDAMGGEGWSAFARVYAFTTGRKDEAEGTANARLIAAAPDLLQALEDIIELVAQCTDDDGRPTYEVCQTDDFSSVRAAIAKAKGDDHDT